MFTKHDKQGAYVDIPDDDNDSVTLMKNDGGFFYRIRGDVITKLARLEHLEIMLRIIKGGNREQH